MAVYSITLDHIVNMNRMVIIVDIVPRICKAYHTWVLAYPQAHQNRSSPAANVTSNGATANGFAGASGTVPSG